jgi:hypothetical protein
MILLSSEDPPLLRGSSSEDPSFFRGSFFLQRILLSSEDPFRGFISLKDFSPSVGPRSLTL